MEYTNQLTPRQKFILQHIVEDYINSGIPVGSSTLEKKYEIGVSPATIRNEMVRLTQKGFLIQPHTSAGRIPTGRALKFYVQNLMKEQTLSVTDEVSVKEKIWDCRFEADKFLHQVTRVLAEKTGNLAFAQLTNGGLFHAGYANILDAPEFFNIDAARALLSAIEKIEQIQRLLARGVVVGRVSLIFGEDLDIDFLEPIGAVFTNFKIDDKAAGALGVIGSSRLDYPRIIPIVCYFSDLINQACQV
ncbi:hypothetical protein KKD62_01785 [Patescibacteria group bacterium]|nr:hypothetical protein [Patescibacteria group bacterium]MBU1931081.1 hypothetical protein [Patescibacteria group bacterium]